MRQFARVELGDDPVPDESTILRLGHRSSTVPAQLFAVVRSLLADQSLLLNAGTIADSTILHA
ncbi:MAG: hypothetical protein IPK85_08215 [Gemmatimonadetes bacterium]|nr:hypothetical protein [Gemmatimonadota bacterium]